MRLTEREIERLRTRRVLGEQVAEIRRRLMCCRYGQQHVVDRAIASDCDIPQILFHLLSPRLRQKLIGPDADISGLTLPVGNDCGLRESLKSGQEWPSRVPAVA